MPFSEADKAVIEACFLEKNWRGRRITREFKSKKWSRRSVDNVIKKIEVTGSTQRKKGSGRPATVCTDANAARTEELIASQEDRPGSHLSQRKTAQRLNISRTGVQRIISKKLEFKPFKRIKTSRKSTEVKQKRKTRARRLLDTFSADDVKRIVFTDEKNFCLEPPLNHRNDFVYGKKKMDIPVPRLYHEKNQFSKKVMVSAGVSWNGKTGIHIIEKGTKVNSVAYVALLHDLLVPDMEQLYPENNYILQQDGASSHTSKFTRDYLRENQVPHIPKDDWPPESADLNPMDYAIWNQLSELVYKDRQTPFPSVEALSDQIKESWLELNLMSVRKSITGWKKRLRCVIRADGGSIDHLRF